MKPSYNDNEPLDQAEEWIIVGFSGDSWISVIFFAETWSYLKAFVVSSQFLVAQI